MSHAVGEAEISDDDIAMAVEQQILELEVPMNDFLLVDVPDARDELREELAGILLPQVAVGEDVIKQLASGGVFEDDTDVLVGLDHIVQPDDVRVFESLPYHVMGGPKTSLVIENVPVEPLSRVQLSTCARSNLCFPVE